jgi:serine/threonine protein kinase
MSQKEKEQLQAELSILKELKHPNIVEYYEREHLKDSQYLHLYMEYCGNGDLGQVISEYKARGELPPENFVWSILAQLVSALYRCHNGVDPPDVGDNLFGLGSALKQAKAKAAGKPGKTYTVLHRDLKPDNGVSPGRSAAFIC